MNLQSNTERWISNTIDSLVSSANKSSDWSTALATVDAISNVLAKFGEVYISEAGDVEVFLFVTNPEKGKIFAAIVKKDATTGEFVPIRQTDAAGARELAASFICDFPNAVMTLDGGQPLWLFIKEADEKLWLTLDNMAKSVRAGHTKFAVAVPKQQEEDKK